MDKLMVCIIHNNLLHAHLMKHNPSFKSKQNYSFSSYFFPNKKKKAGRHKIIILSVCLIYNFCISWTVIIFTWMQDEVLPLNMVLKYIRSS